MDVSRRAGRPGTRIFRARDQDLALGNRPLLMGVLNVTPDSFSDGGLHDARASALHHVRQMLGDGADIIDVGGESTRPGSTPVPAAEELGRVLPVIHDIRAHEPSAIISVDTMKVEIARRALAAGAHIVNDVWGLQRDPAMASAVADAGAGLIVMHNRERADPAVDIMDEVLRFLARSITIALQAGVREDAVAVDPGVGFGKTPEQSAEVIRRLAELRVLGFPILLGASRKRFIGGLTGVENPKARLAGTLAAHIAGVLAGADIIRVHDVKPHRDAFRVFAACWSPQNDL